MIRVGLFVLACAVVGCRCSDPPRPRAEPVSPESAPITMPPPLEPAPERTRDGVAIPPTLLRQLESPNAAEPEAPVDDDLGVRCARGCALIDANDQVVVVRAIENGREPVPARIEITTLGDADAARREVSLEDVDAEALTAFVDEGGVPPWATLVRRALDRGPYRAAPDLVAARARTFFALEEHAPLVALRAPLGDRWLYAEVGPTAYRLHLLRADRSVDRLLAWLPLVATACTAELTDRACIAPLSIDGAVLSPDARTLHVLVDHAGVRDERAEGGILSVGLDDASALPTLYDEAARDAELERSLRAPGARTSPFVPRDAEPATVAARCLRGCALFRESGDAWIVRPTRVERGVVRAARIFVPGPDASGLEVLGLEHAGDDPAREALLERALAAAPSAEGRALVARQGLAATDGTASVARVELRAPHVGAQVSIDIDAGEYVLRWGRGSTWTEIGRVPAILSDGEVSAPSVLEVFAPPDRGFPLVIVGVAVSRRPADPEGIAHQSFHTILAALPEGVSEPNARGTARTERPD